MERKNYYRLNLPLLFPSSADRAQPGILVFFLALSTAIVGILTIYMPVQSVLFFLAAIVVLLIFHKPAAGYYLVIGFAAFSNVYFKFKEGNENILFLFPLILITYGAWLMHRSAKLQEKAAGNPINIYVWFFFAWAAVSIFWSIDRHHGFFKLLDLLMCVVTLQLPFLFIRDRKALDNTMKCLLVTGAVAAIIVFASKWFPQTITSSISKNIIFYLVIIKDKMRAGGIGPPNADASVLNFFIFVNLAVMLTAAAGRRMRIISFAAVLFMMMDVVMTGSKAAFGTMIMGLFLLIFIIPSLRKKAIYYSCIAALMIVITFLAGAFLSSKDISKTRVLASSGEGTTRSIDSRLGWWSTGFEYLDKSDFVGIGIGGGLPLIEPVRSFHSLYFSVLFELGIIGMALFVLILIRLLYSFIRAVFSGREGDIHTISYCMIAGMFTFFMGSLVGGEFNVVQFWWQAGIALAVLCIAETEGVDKYGSSNNRAEQG